MSENLIGNIESKRLKHIRLDCKALIADVINDIISAKKTINYNQTKAESKSDKSRFKSNFALFPRYNTHQYKKGFA